MISYDARSWCTQGGLGPAAMQGPSTLHSKIKRKIHGLISGNLGNLETVLRKHFKSEKEKAVCTKIWIVVLPVKLINQKQ